MRALLAGLLGVLLALQAVQPGLAQAPASNAKPVIVYIETNPWLMVIGSDSPQFALYDDGTVIFRTSEGYRHTELSAEQRTEIEAAINLEGIHHYLEYSRASDQPSSYLFDFRSNQAVMAYGAVSRRHSISTENDPLLPMINLLRGFRQDDAEPWFPAFIEVMIWPYEYAPEESIIWPSDWPGIDDARTEERGDAFSLFFPSARREELFAFLETRRERGAIEIGGRKWAASLRYPFPGEEHWQIDGSGDASEEEQP